MESAELGTEQLNPEADAPANEIVESWVLSG
jgi:hypothetical protein